MCKVLLHKATVFTIKAVLRKKLVKAYMMVWQVL